MLYLAIDDISFTSEEHKARFLEVMQRIGKIDGGTFDPEYGAALYALTSHLSLWRNTQGHVSRHGIDLPTMLEEVDFSSGFVVLITFVGNLFNEWLHIDPIELLRLDEKNFQIALVSLKIRRYGLVASKKASPDSLATAG